MTAWRRSAALVDLAPLSLVILAEAAWLSAFAALIQALSSKPPSIGIVGFAIFVATGVLATRLLAPRLGRRWPIVVPGLVGIAAVAGTLISPDARAALGEGPASVLSANPAGWIAGLAVLRGVARAPLPVPEDSIARLLTIGVPGLAMIALAGVAVVEPYRAPFQSDVMAAAVVFVVAATLALSLTRLTAVGYDGGFDWRRNPAWIGLVLVILAVAIVSTVSLTTVGASVLQVLAGVAVGALVIVALSAGFDRSAIRLISALIVFQLGIYLLVSRLGPGRPLPEVPDAGSGSEGNAVATDLLTLGLGGLVLLAVVIAIVVLATIWMRRTRTPVDDPVQESRTIDRGAVADRARPDPRRSRRRRRDPDGAPAAYVALLTDLEPHPNVRREPAETPAEHASRLREQGRAGLALEPWPRITRSSGMAAGGCRRASIAAGSDDGSPCAVGSRGRPGDLRVLVLLRDRQRRGRRASQRPVLRGDRQLIRACWCRLGRPDRHRRGRVRGIRRDRERRACRQDGNAQEDRRGKPVCPADGHLVRRGAAALDGDRTARGDREVRRWARRDRGSPADVSAGRRDRERTARGRPRGEQARGADAAAARHRPGHRRLRVDDRTVLIECGRRELLGRANLDRCRCRCDSDRGHDRPTRIAADIGVEPARHELDEPDSATGEAGPLANDRGTAGARCPSDPALDARRRPVSRP